LRARPGSSAGMMDPGEMVVVCEQCGSQFRHDAGTRRSCYIHVSQAHAAVAPALAGKWLTRRQVFEACRNAPAPAPRAAASSIVWLAVLGMAAVVAMTCACLSAILLGPSMSETRRQIAAANALGKAALNAGAPLTDTDVMTGEVAAATGEPAGGLDLPAGPAETATPVPDMSAPGEELPPDSVTPTAPPQPVEGFPELQPTPAPPEATPPEMAPPPTPASTPTLPPTFTPVPSPAASPTAAAPVNPLNSPLPAVTPTAPAATPADAGPSPTPSPTPTSPSVAPSTTPTSGVVMTGAIVISTILYQGDPNLNEGDEYVEIENRGNERVNMGFWTLRSLSTNALFSFGNAVGMDPGNVCRVYTYIAAPDQRCGIGSALTFLSAVPVWSNTGDVAELRDANGVLISRFIYGTPPPFQ